MNELINPIRQEYLDHIKKQKSSGLSIKKYCQEQELVPHKFSYYQTYKKKPTKLSELSSVFASVKLKKSTQDMSKANKSYISSKVDPVWLAKFIHSLVIER